MWGEESSLSQLSTTLVPPPNDNILQQIPRLHSAAREKEPLQKACVGFDI